MKLNQVTVPTNDVQASIDFYTGLSLELIVRSPHYARFACPDGDSTFSVHLSDESPGAAVVYFECDDLDARCSALKAAGYLFDSEPQDQSWRWREARLRDPSGNLICLFLAGADRLNPPWRIRSDPS